MAKLIIKTEGVAVPLLELRLGVNRIGRGEDNDFQILHPTISTHHCELILGDGTVLLRDCGSTNGSFVNGRRVKELQLQPGHTVHLGDVELFVESTEFKVVIPEYARPQPAPAPAPPKTRRRRVVAAPATDKPRSFVEMLKQTVRLPFARRKKRP